MNLRSRKMEQTYLGLIAKGFFASGCNLCKKEKSIKIFKYWRIINNIFPWDNIAETQHMIIPKRHITFDELNKTEKNEFDKIKSKYIEKKYDLIAEATTKRKSIPGHLHVHLIILKK